MQHRRVAHLDQLAVLGGAVDGQLVRGPVERVLGLQDAQRDLEAFQVLLEAAVPLPDLHRLGEAGFVAGGQLHALRFGQLEHGLEPQTAVEMAVQVGLRQSVQQLRGDRDVGSHGSIYHAGP